MRERILARILDGTYKPGDKLPRDEDIAAQLGCARSTVQRAMGDLSDAGIVERKRKGGTHVRPDPVTRATFDIPITRKEVEQRGSVYGYQLVRLSAQDAPPVGRREVRPVRHVPDCCMSRRCIWPISDPTCLRIAGSAPIQCRKY